MSNNCSTFAAAFIKRVPWMSGLVNGLQNRLQQFESARHLSLMVKQMEESQLWLSFFNVLNVTLSRCHDVTMSRNEREIRNLLGEIADAERVTRILFRKRVGRGPCNSWFRGQSGLP